MRYLCVCYRCMRYLRAEWLTLSWSDCCQEQQDESDHRHTTLWHRPSHLDPHSSLDTVKEQKTITRKVTESSNWRRQSRRKRRRGRRRATTTTRGRERVGTLRDTDSTRTKDDNRTKSFGCWCGSVFNTGMKLGWLTYLGFLVSTLCLASRRFKATEKVYMIAVFVLFGIFCTGTFHGQWRRARENSCVR